MKYIKRPVAVDVVQWTGYNFDKVSSFIEGINPIVNASNDLIFETTNGEVSAPPGSYIIHGADGFYPCHADVFEEVYVKLDVGMEGNKVFCPFCEKTFEVTIPQTYYDCLRDEYRYIEVCPNCKKVVRWSKDG